MYRTMRFVYTLAALALLFLSGCTSINSALITGDNQTVVAVDLDTGSTIGEITLPAAAGTGSGLATPVLAISGTRAFLSGADYRTYILNISDSGVTFNDTSPLRLPDDGLVRDSASANPWMLVRSNPPGIGNAISVNNTLDLSMVVSSLPMRDGYDQVLVCDDGETVLVRDAVAMEVRLFNLDRGGILTDTGHALSFERQVRWIACAPGAAAGAAMLVSNEVPAVVAFRIDATDGLVAGSSVYPHGAASGEGGNLNNSIAFAADATGLFVRSSRIGGGDQDGWLERFSFDPATATIGATPEFTVRAGVSYTGGRNQIGVDPEGGRVYVPNAFFPGGRVDIFDAESGASLGHITHPDMPNPLEFIVNK